MEMLNKAGSRPIKMCMGHCLKQGAVGSTSIQQERLNGWVTHSGRRVVWGFNLYTICENV
jgi:hypothetical protein